MKSIPLIFFAWLGLASFSLADPVFQGSWRLAELQVTRRRMHGMACTAGDMFVHGGLLADGTTTNSLWRFRASTNSWTFLTPAGEAPFLLGLTLNYIDPNLYAFGGSSTLENPNPVSDIYILDVNSTAGIHKNLWVRYSPDSGPSPRFRHRTVTVGKTMVAMFGFGMDKYQNTVWEFNTVTMQWTRLHPGGSGPNIPAPRFDPCCKYTSDFNATYCFGGTTEEDDTNELWVFMHGDNTWKLLDVTGQVPPPRRSATCGILNGVFFLASGLNSTSGVPQGWDIYQLNLRDPSNTWVLSTQPKDPKLTPDPRDQALMCDRFNGTTMLFGGINGDGVHHNDLWAVTTLPSGLLSYRNVQYDTDMPARRHSGIIRTLGSGVIVGFGRADVGLFDDLWKLDMTKEPEAWTRLSAVGNSGFPPRFGNRAVVRGSLLMLFGGQTSASDKLQLSSDLLTFDMDTRKWGIIKPQTTTEGRVYHGMVNSGLLVLVFGGYAKCSSGVCITSDVRLYDPVTQTWNIGVPTDSNIPSARFGHEVTINFRNGWSYIIGGLNSRTALSTRWRMSPASAFSNSSGTYYSVTFQRLPSTFGNRSERVFIRGGGAIAGFQNHYMVCGGLISPLMGPRDTYQCYDYDANTGLNTLLPPSPYSVRYGASVYVMNKVVVFGGGLLSSSVPMTDRELNYVMIFDVNPQSYCAAGVTDDTGCLMCAPGSKNPTCDIAPAGTYQDNPSGDPIPCVPGTYSTYKGAYLKGFCRFCEKGYYASGTGATGCTPCPVGKKCPLGQPEPVDLDKAAEDSTGVSGASETTLQPIDNMKQPSAFTGMFVPDWVYQIFLAIVCFVVVFTTALFLIQRRQLHRRIAYYIPEDQQNALHIVYADYARPLGLGKEAFEKYLRDERMPTAKLILPQHIDRLYQECNDGGSGLIRFERVCVFIGHLIEQEILDPFENTPASENIQYPSSVLDHIDLLSYDSFTDSHRTMDVGEPIVITKTTIGGFISIANMTFQIILVALLITMFSYDNIQETRSVLPGELVSASDITTSFAFTVTQDGGRDPSICVNPTSGGCASGVSATVDGISSKGGNSSVACTFMAPASCSIQWTCDDCSIPNLDASVNFTFHPNWFAIQTRIDMSIRSGVETFVDSTLTSDYSTASVQFDPPEGSVFKGAPASVAHVVLTPTLFESPRNSYDQNPQKDKGYHIRYDPRSQAGHTVDASQFAQFYGAPVVITMETAASTLIVKREFKQSFVALITGILGAVSGLAGAMIFALGFLEGMHKDHHERKLNQLRGGNLSELQREQTVIEELKNLSAINREESPKKKKKKHQDPDEVASNPPYGTEGQEVNTRPSSAVDKNDNPPKNVVVFPSPTRKPNKATPGVSNNNDFSQKDSLANSTRVPSKVLPGLQAKTSAGSPMRKVTSMPFDMETDSVTTADPEWLTESGDDFEK